MVLRLIGSCPNRSGFPFVVLAAGALSLFLLFQSHAVSADSTPYPATIADWGVNWGSAPWTYGFSSNTAACQSLGHGNYYIFEYLTNGSPLDGFDGGFGAGRCWYSILGRPDLGIQHYDIHWIRVETCPRGGSPDDARLENPMCICPAGYDFNIPDPIRGGPVCVPSTCPVEPLTPYSPDPYPLDIDNLAPRMQTGLQCLQAAIGRQTSPGGNPGTSTVDSAYRPSSYNRHLQEVWDKWDELDEDRRPECQSLRTEVRDHFNSHDLIPSARARPHTNSAHTRGQAFDLSSNLYDGVLDVLAVDCNVYRPDPLGDPPHFIHR